MSIYTGQVPTRRDLTSPDPDLAETQRSRRQALSDGENIAPFVLGCQRACLTAPLSMSNLGWGNLINIRNTWAAVRAPALGGQLATFLPETRVSDTYF